MAMVYIGIACCLVSSAAIRGSIPTLARPSVMSTIELLSVAHESVEFARSIASPMAVPESQGSSWRMYDVSICESVELIPRVSDEKGIDTNAFPANTISQKLSSLRSERNVSIVCLAASIRLGLISSASIERDMSRTMRMFCFSATWYTPFL